jgi:hypothetical protein
MSGRFTKQAPYNITARHGAFCLGRLRLSKDATGLQQNSPFNGQAVTDIMCLC